MAVPNKRTARRWTVAGGMIACLAPVPAEDELAALWRGVEAEAAGSVFQSWLWLGCRFAVRFDRAMVLTIESGGRVLAIGLLSRTRRAGLARFVLAETYLSETGRDDEDSVFIEHNGPLVVRDRPEARAAWFGALLLRSVGGRPVRLSGIGAADAAAAAQVGRLGTAVTRVAPRRDLARLRREGADCLAGVSANTRQQINRALRRYGASGAVTVVRAADTAQALDWLDRLAVLHQATWVARGKPGAFAGPAFRRFHAELVARGVPDGAVDVLRIAAGPLVIGYLYNFVWRGVVSAYQSGFDYAAVAGHGKPGLVCHVAAMRYYQARGLDIYDFLAGDDRYKTSLADEVVTLRWVTAAPRGSVAGLILAAGARIARAKIGEV